MSSFAQFKLSQFKLSQFKLRPSRSRPMRLLLGFGLGILLLGLGANRAAAIDRATLNLLTKPLEPALFEPGPLVLDPSIITPDRISQTGLTPPSLWWTEEQFDNLLLSYWLAYSGSPSEPRRVDLIVDQQIWNSSNYLQRYAFMNQYGTATKDFGYNMRVFNLQGDLLGAHICQFDPAIPNLDTPCSIFLNSSGRGALRGTATPFGVPSPTDGDVLLGP